MTEDLFVVENSLNYWFNLMYGNYLDFINHLSKFSFFSEEDMDKEGRYWVNWLSSYNIIKNICVGWKNRLIKLQFFSKQEYEEKLEEYQVMKYKDILIEEIRNSLFHRPQGEWGFDNRVETIISVKIDIDEENQSATLRLQDRDKHYPVLNLNNENENIKDIIDHVMVSQRLLIDWVVMRIYKYYGLDIEKMDQYVDEFLEYWDQREIEKNLL